MIKLTIQRSIRSRVSILILFLLLLFLFIMPLTVLDDGSVKGKVQIQLMWTTGLCAMGPAGTHHHNQPVVLGAFKVGGQRIPGPAHFVDQFDFRPV